jgi:hypothetical protein
MLDYAKYLVTGGAVEQLVFFPHSLPHAAVATMLGGAKVISAGFLSLVTNPQGKISVNCYGRSQSLDLAARPEDAQLAARALHLDA